MKRAKRRGSLKWNMIVLLLVCWVLPVVLVVSFSGIYITNTVQKQTREMILSSTQSALDTTKSRVNSAVTASLALSYNPGMLDTWLQDYWRDNNYYQFALTANTLLSQQYRYDDKFIGAFLLMNDAEEHTFNVSDNLQYSEMLQFWRTMKEPVKARCDQLGTGIAFMQEGEHLYLVRNLLTSSYYKYGILILEVDTTYLFGDMEGVPFTDGYCVWLGDTVHHSKNGVQMAWDDALQASAVEYGEVNGVTAVYGQIKERNYPMRYIMPVNMQLVYGQLQSTKIILIALCIILLPLLGIVLLFFYKKVTQPMDKFMLAAKKIEEGNFGTHLDADDLASAEFGYLGDSFNNMSDKLQYQFERIYKEELALRDARIMALQSQINPHFLNNTLEIINWEARLSGDIKVCKMIEALSTMLSAAMDRNARPLVHLSEELMYVDSYLYIIRERLGKRLAIFKEIDEDLLDCFVPRLVLQPIIENAVEHGVNPTRQGIITIRAYQKDGKLYLEIENDAALSEEDQRRIEALLCDEVAPEGYGSTSLGIRNVNQRLRILYGNDCGLLVEMTNEGKTLSRICIQIQQG